MRRKTWQYATTLPAEKLSQIQNPLIKPERYVEHAYNPLHRRYEYDPAGELSRTLDKLRGEVTYEYEANGRLLEHNPEKRFDGEEFRYDAAGNRLNFNTSRFDRVKDNRLKKWSNHEYKYDAWGNLVEKIVGIVRWQTFTYDCENRLVKTETMANSQVESTSSYQYDSLGRRVGKQWEIKGKTGQKRFLWQGLRLLREESPGKSSLYLYEPGSYAPLARTDEKEGEVENKVYYFHTDQIGTPLEMTDAEGQIVWQAKYRLWGAVEKLVVNEVEQNIRFQGQYFDVETGLHYNTFRYYDPETGRFITQDPIGLSGGLNLYSYAPSSTSWVDPFGLSCESLKGKYSSVEKANLPSWVAESFTNGKYKTVVTTQDIYVYRVFGGNAKASGGFVSTSPASSRIQAKLDAALLPEWKNTRQFEAKILIPKGTILNIGSVAPQVTKSGTIFKGGADQILMPQNWPESWIVGIKTIRTP
ncbi:RHS repeat-associated core domain-containing protein [Pseudomonas sp. BS3767]|uniref:RHS repeat-associated core domain-containing protein n=2 Tax=Pseudomonas syringae TaxID=317 RepID=A0AB37ZLS0_PSESX|nr:MULTISPECIES: RHS repeat-associated core domain-containing protein [Pseudomonas]SDI04638.1 RHS repeat-associated core domain-containing protein [Pseudomonas sp. BS3767]SDM98709.1 RHS repeat-associated core domain-containing protein [Pseudomonas syringae]SDO15481.1 RHS repeat-associated core domain-containing protein [Pseudomonas sp. BS3759]